MDKTEACGASDPGSIPGGSIDYPQFTTNIIYILNLGSGLWLVAGCWSLLYVSS